MVKRVKPPSDEVEDLDGPDVAVIESDVDPESLWEPIRRLTKDLRDSAGLLRPEQVRWLVQAYYRYQHFRTESEQHVKAAEKAEQPNELITWTHDAVRFMENDLRRALHSFASHYHVGRWMLARPGIGPVITAGLLTYIDIRCYDTVGKIWRLAGVDPSRHWNSRDDATAMVQAAGISDKFDEAALRRLADLAGYRYEQLEEVYKEGFHKHKKKTALSKFLARRPWIADLKTLVTYKLGESIVKFQNKEGNIYGPIFANRKAYEIDRNLRGELVDQAAAGAARVAKTTIAWPWFAGCYPSNIWEGWLMLDLEERKSRMAKLRLQPGQGVPMLPPAHIHARARRYAAKMFLSHLHHVMYADFFGTLPPKPFSVTLPGHSHFVPPPGWPDTALGGVGLAEMYKNTEPAQPSLHNEDNGEIE